MSEQTEQQPTGADGTLNGAPGISSTAEALLAARGNSTPASAPGPAADGDQTHTPKDVQMSDAPLDQATLPPSQTPTATPGPLPATTPTPSSAPATAPQPTPPPPNAASPLPARTSTPMRNGEGNAGGAGSRATSAHPDQGPAMPAEAAVHGAPVRQYMNAKVTPVLLEAMKIIAKEQPKDPLRVLGEIFLQRSKELEGTTPP